MCNPEDLSPAQKLASSFIVCFLLRDVGNFRIIAVEMEGLAFSTQPRKKPLELELSVTNSKCELLVLFSNDRFLIENVVCVQCLMIYS